MTSPATFNSGGPGKAHPLEKVLRFAIVGILGFGAIKLFNWIAPTFITFFTNIYLIAALGLPLLFITMWALSNRGLIWMTYKNICRKITEALIKIDFLSYIDSYIEILEEKLANLRQNKDALLGQYKAFEKNIEDVEGNVETNLKMALAAKKLGDQSQMEYHSSLGNTSKQSLERLRPVADRMKRNLDFLDKLEENWDMSIDKLKHEVKIRRDEYTHMRDAAKALGQIESFMRGDSEESKIFYASLQQLDNSLADKVAKIDAFEKRSKNMMNTIDLEKQMNSDEGLLLLDQFEQHGSEVFLPATYAKDAILVDAKVVSSQPLKKTQFNLLGKK